MRKVRVIIILSMISFTAFFLDMEMSNAHQNEQLSESADTIKTATSYQPITGEGLYIVEGPIKPGKPLELYDLLPEENDFFVLKLKVEIVQKVEKSKNGSSKNWRSRLRHPEIFVEEIPKKFRNDKITNNNFKTWPIPYQTTLKYADNFWLRDSIPLNSELFIEALERRQKKIFGLYPIDFDPPQLLNKTIHKKSKGVYFYGDDPKKPKLGDIKIKLSGFSKTDTSQFLNVINYTLLGEYSAEKGLEPFYNTKTNKKRYYFWTYTPFGGDFAAAKIEVNRLMTSSPRLSIFLIRFAFFIMCCWIINYFYKK